MQTTTENDNSSHPRDRSAMMGDTSNRTGSPVIHFHEDHFTYDAKRRGFFLAEPDTLLGDRIARVDVMAFRVDQGWKPMTTVKLEDGDVLGVIDIWTRTEDLDTLE